MPLVVPVIRYVVGVVVVEDILARRKRGGLFGVGCGCCRCGRYLLDPIVVVLMPAYQEGGWGVVAFVPLSFVFLAPGCLLLLMPV